MSSASATNAHADDATAANNAADDVTSDKKDEAAESDGEEAELTSSAPTGALDEKSASLGEDELERKLDKATKVS